MRDSSSGAVLKTAFMSQAALPIWDGPDSFTCQANQYWTIHYYPLAATVAACIVDSGAIRLGRRSATFRLPGVIQHDLG